MNKYNIIAAAAGSLLLGACNVDDSNDTPLVELGARTTEFTVGATAGHVDIDVLTNRRCHLRFLEETPWAELSSETLDGDSSFYIDYDDNDDFPRMTRVLIEADNKLHRDTITLRAARRADSGAESALRFADRFGQRFGQRCYSFRHQHRFFRD